MPPKPSSQVVIPFRFIALMASLTALMALSIDAMLPALGEISTDLGSAAGTRRQLIITTVFLGVAVAQLFFGPLSDSIGRKPPMYIGLVIFIVGSVVSTLATTMEVMLIGRFLQGVGAASPRVVTMAIIRDRYSGDAMASVMSLMMVIFILVPTLAPALGQAVVLVSHWRMIFVLFTVFALVIGLWFWRGQAETLPPERRRRFSASALLLGVAEVIKTRVAIGYTLAAGFIFGAFVGFLSSSQQILQEHYDLGSRFPLYFATMALSFGIASLLNSRLVLRFGMRRLTAIGIATIVITSLGYTATALLKGSIGLYPFMGFLMLTAFAFAIVYGSASALSMEPMGHIAGTASAVISSLTTLISLSLGTIIGTAFDGTSSPLIFGYLVSGILSALMMFWTEAPWRK